MSKGAGQTAMDTVPAAEAKRGLLLRSTALVTVCAVLGLALGFLREILIIRRWGASALTDSIVAAVFIPEAVRMMLSGGIVVSAALPLWIECRASTTGRVWSATITTITVAAALLAILLLWIFDGPLLHIVAPGLGSASMANARHLLDLVAPMLLGISLHAMLTLYHHADGRFLLPALGPALFNGAASLALLAGDAATPEMFAKSLVVGSVAMMLPLLPHAWRQGWRPLGAVSLPMIVVFARRFWPLLLGGLSGQGVLLMERALASFVGEGSVALINLGRKLIQLPAVAIHSLALVVLSRIASAAGDAQEQHLRILRAALVGLTILTWPGLVVCLIWAPVAGILLPRGTDPAVAAVLADLIRCYAPAIVFGGWSTIIARYLMATGATLKPTALELAGVALQLFLMGTLFPVIGLFALPAGYSVGYVGSALLLASRTPLSRSLPLIGAVLLAGAGVTAVGVWAYPFHPERPLLWQAVEAAICYGAVGLLGIATLGRLLRTAA
jgi:peptidoglycan biosynthesis protein MviN/MurJ (putative lipid II flippase)